MKPACSYCTRHSVECSFLVTEPNVLPSIASLHLISRNASPARRSSEDILRGGPSNPENDSRLCSNLHMLDLELLLHFSTTTAPTISAQNPTNDAIWSTVVPKLALDHPFLMHGILGVAALHLSRLRPERKQEYIMVAAKHENIALPFFRAEAVNITDKNFAPTFVFSTLIVLYTMASHNHSGGLFSAGFSTGDGLPEWLHLLRGVDSITKPRIHLMSQGPLAPLLDLQRFQDRVLSLSDELPLNILSTLFTIPPNTPPDRVAELEIYKETLSLLRNSFTNPANPNMPSQPVPYIWFTLISDAFMQFLSERRAEALVLLAYECVILKRLEPCWFLDGIADRMMRTVMENLLPEWRFWVEWPLQEMGLQEMASE